MTNTKLRKRDYGGWLVIDVNSDKTLGWVVRSSKGRAWNSYVVQSGRSDGRLVGWGETRRRDAVSEVVIQA